MAGVNRSTAIFWLLWFRLAMTLLEFSQTIQGQYQCLLIMGEIDLVVEDILI